MDSSGEPSSIQPNRKCTGLQGCSVGPIGSCLCSLILGGNQSHVMKRGTENTACLDLNGCVSSREAFENNIV